MEKWHSLDFCKDLSRYSQGRFQKCKAPTRGSRDIPCRKGFGFQAFELVFDRFSEYRRRIMPTDHLTLACMRSSYKIPKDLLILSSDLVRRCSHKITSATVRHAR